MSLEDVWTGPHEEGFESDIYIKWRMEGANGLADGTIGWPDYPKGSPSTLRYSCRATNGKWVQPNWTTRWFPQAFKGVMEQLQYAVKTGTEPELERFRQLEDNGADRSRVSVSRREADP